MATEIKIEKKVPIPAHSENVNGKRLYPFDELKVGDSFFVPEKMPAEISGSKQQAKRRTKFEFMVRRAELDGVRGIRVWRIK